MQLLQLELSSYMSALYINKIRGYDESSRLTIHCARHPRTVDNYVQKKKERKRRRDDRTQTIRRVETQYKTPPLSHQEFLFFHQQTTAESWALLWIRSTRRKIVSSFFFSKIKRGEKKQLALLDGLVCDEIGKATRPPCYY